MVGGFHGSRASFVGTPCGKSLIITFSKVTSTATAESAQLTMDGRWPPKFRVHVPSVSRRLNFVGQGQTLLSAFVVCVQVRGSLDITYFQSQFHNAENLKLSLWRSVHLLRSRVQDRE